MPHIVYEDMVFAKPLRWGHRFVIKTRFLGWDDKHVVAQHIFERGDGKVAAEGFTVARFVSMKGERIPVAEVMNLLNHQTKSPELSDKAHEILVRAVNGYDLQPAPLEQHILQAAE
jgi:hypothetical protein